MVWNWIKGFPCNWTILIWQIWKFLIFFAILARRSTSFFPWVSMVQRSKFALFQFCFMRRWKESALFRWLLFLYQLYRFQDSDISTLVIKSAARHMLGACDLLHQLRMTRKCVPSRVQSLNPGFDFFCITGTCGFFIGPLKTWYLIWLSCSRSLNFMGSRHLNIWQIFAAERWSAKYRISV